MAAYATVVDGPHGLPVTLSEEQDPTMEASMLCDGIECCGSSAPDLWVIGYQRFCTDCAVREAADQFRAYLDPSFRPLRGNGKAISQAIEVMRALTARVEARVKGE